MCSLIKAVHQIYYEKESRDDAQLGREISKVSAMALEQGPKDIKEAGLDCSHVNYEDLVSNPLQTVKNIYKQFGWIVTEEYERNILEYLEKNSAEREELKQQKSKDPSSLHSYTPEEFSLTADDLTAGTFGEYVKKFNLQMSKG